MAKIKTKDGAEIFYKDWGQGQPIVFCHGWPVNADMWESQMLFLASKGFRCIAYDRRGFGRSDQPWSGYDYDILTDDMAALIEALDLSNVVLTGFSMGGGEVARYIGRHGSKRIAKAVLISAVTPYMIKASDNPDGVDRSVLDGMRSGITANRQEFIAEFGKTFYGANRLLTKIPQPTMDWTFGMVMQSSIKAMYDCVKTFSETDLRADLKKFTVPTLVIHGDDDQTVPIDISGKLAAKLIPNAQLAIYKGAPHGLFFTHKDKLNADLLTFIQNDQLALSA